MIIQTLFRQPAKFALLALTLSIPAGCGAKAQSESMAASASPQAEDWPPPSAAASPDDAFSAETLAVEPLAVETLAVETLAVETLRDPLSQARVGSEPPVAGNARESLPAVRPPSLGAATVKTPKYTAAPRATNSFSPRLPVPPSASPSQHGGLSLNPPIAKRSAASAAAPVETVLPQAVAEDIAEPIQAQMKSVTSADAGSTNESDEMQSAAWPLDARELEAFPSEAFPMEIAAARQPERATIDQDLPVRTSTPSANQEAAGPKTVDVFFATDRLPTSELIPSPLRTFAPAAVVGMICCTLFIGFSLTRRFYAMWMVGCGLAVCLGITVLHTSIIRWQQYSRLASNASTCFSPLRDEGPRDYPLHVGTAKVSLPPTHQPGRFEQPQLLKFEFVETSEKHIVLHRLRVENSAAAWFEEISQAAGDSDEQAGFIFIHGYNVRFIDALKRTAQLANDLELNGPAICYSWPSRGEVAAYTVDEATVSWSAPHFERLLLDLHARTQCRQINVIAHSMGNRALLEAIERIDLRMSSQSSEANQPVGKLIDSLVMAAPDVDMEKFATRYARPLQNVAARATLYFSDDDRALQLSAGLHGSPRLGFDSEKLRDLAGIEPIHVDTHDFLSLGHSYYADDPAVVQDLRDLLHGRQPAAERPLLRSVVKDSGLAYWQIDRGLHAQLSTSRNR